MPEETKSVEVVDTPQTQPADGAITLSTPQDIDANTAYGESPIAISQALLAGGMDVNDLKEILAVQKEYEAHQAKKAYVRAMAAFKADPPKIVKDSIADFTTKKGRTSYRHATLGNVSGAINSGLGKHGFSVNWKTNQSGEKITVDCIITHEMGHSEKTTLSGAPDLTGNKNILQATGSTISYLQRYTLLAATGLATHDQDDDGQGASVQLISDTQVSEITDMINEYVKDADHFLSWVSGECRTSVVSVDQIPASAYGIVKSALVGLKDKK